jgi:uncharacterized protein YhaN
MKRINVKYLILTIILFVFIGTGCRHSQDGQAQLQSEIDALQNQIRKIEEDYKPGFGELMSTVRAHHAKLWYAGENENWKLAEFEVHEIEETFEKIVELRGDEHNAAELVPELIDPLLKNVEGAAQKQELAAFKRDYQQLTSGCNDCHSEADVEFIRIQIPTEPGFYNQKFNVKN